MVSGNQRVFLEVIERNYKSLTQPDFSFVDKAISSKPYGMLIEKLRDFFEVEELTDSNDDVGFRYVVSKSNDHWIIELSMLGRYAAVFRISKAGRTEFVSPDTTVPEEMNIISLLLGDQFEILGQDELELSVALKLFNAEPENVCLYQALFSDVDVLPWKA